MLDLEEKKSIQNVPQTQTAHQHVAEVYAGAAVWTTSWFTRPTFLKDNREGVSEIVSCPLCVAQTPSAAVIKEH